MDQCWTTMPHVCVTVFPSWTTQCTMQHHLTSSARSSNHCCLTRLDSSCHSDGRSWGCEERSRKSVALWGVKSSYQPSRWSFMMKYSIRVRTTGSYLRSMICVSPNIWLWEGPTGQGGSRYRPDGVFWCSVRSTPPPPVWVSVMS